MTDNTFKGFDFIKNKLTKKALVQALMELKKIAKGTGEQVKSEFYWEIITTIHRLGDTTEISLLRTG